MKTFTIYVPHDNPQDLEQARFVQEGFHWNAFFFTIFWALYHRMWMVAGVLVLVWAVETEAVEWLNLGGIVDTVLWTGISIWFGFLASDLLGQSLQSRGYELADVVVSKSLTGAQQRFFERQVEARLEQKISELPKPF